MSNITRTLHVFTESLDAPQAFLRVSTGIRALAGQQFFVEVQNRRSIWGSDRRVVGLIRSPRQARWVTVVDSLLPEEDSAASLSSLLGLPVVLCETKGPTVRKVELYEAGARVTHLPSPPPLSKDWTKVGLSDTSAQLLREALKQGRKSKVAVAKVLEVPEPLIGAADAVDEGNGIGADKLTLSFQPAPHRPLAAMGGGPATLREARSTPAPEKTLFLAPGAPFQLRFSARSLGEKSQGVRLRLSGSAVDECIVMVGRLALTVGPRRFEQETATSTQTDVGLILHATWPEVPLHEEPRDSVKEPPEWLLHLDIQGQAAAPGEGDLLVSLSPLENPLGGAYTVRFQVQVLGGTERLPMA